jgi:alanyl-tRNA synthetase
MVRRIKMSEKIYQSDSYCKEITARVMGSEFRDGKHLLRLDRTIFCPAGGGQPADHGSINGLPVRELAIDNGDVIHALERDPGQEEVRLELDFPRRYDHMQQHTAQHLLSQVLLNLFNAPTLSFAIGPEHASIEIGRPGLNDGEVMALEDECARLILANLPVRVFESEDIASLHLRKPPKRAGRIRVVEIMDLDQSACGGTHLKSSAEIGLLKIIKCERVRSNIRLYYVAGTRARRDYQLKHETLMRIQHAVTLPLAEIPGQVEALLAEKEDLRRNLKKMQRRDLEKEIAAAAAGNEPLLVREFSGLDGPDLRFFAVSLLKQGRQALVYARAPQNYLVVGRGRGSFDLRLISARIFGLLDGKGGGSENLIEGRARDFSKLAEVVALLQASLGR